MEDRLLAKEKQGKGTKKRKRKTTKPSSATGAWGVLTRLFIGEPEYRDALQNAELDFVQEATTDLLTLWPEAPLVSLQETAVYVKDYVEVSQGKRRFPDSSRPVLHLLEVVSKLANVEVGLAALCTTISLAGFVPAARVLVCCGFIVAVKLKLHAVRTLIRGPAILFGDCLADFLEGENFKMMGIEFPVRRYIGLTIVSLPTFMEASLSGTALPYAYKANQRLAIASGVLLVVSLVVQWFGTRYNLKRARFGLMMHTGDVMNGAENASSGNICWHYVTVTAALSNLSMIGTCAGRVCDETLKLEKKPLYKCAMHCGSSQASKVWIKGVFTGCPRVIINIALLRREIQLSHRLQMLLAIACTMVGLAQMLQTAISRVKNHMAALREVQQEKKHIKLAIAFITPWRLQHPETDWQTSSHLDRPIPGDTSAYLACVLTLLLLVCLHGLLAPIQQLVHDVWS